MTGSEWMREISEPQPEEGHREAMPMAFFNAAGGAGASTMSALVAGYWADRTVPAGWVDAAPADGDMLGRLGGVSTSTVQRPDGVFLWRPSRIGDLAQVLAEAQNEGLVPMIDAGTTAVGQIRGVQALIAEGVVPVLVIGIRPDLINRARGVLSVWEDRGVLASAVVVLNAAVPGIRENVVREQLLDVLHVAARDCVGVDYDPTLGTGLSLSSEDRDQLAPATAAAVEQIALHATPRRLAVAQ
ncbi:MULTISPECIES: hypothetical protein [Gordonia]|uniref:hypothetical protein n=1 Tax=Gordonia TaxID=2053 RepID=UPI000C799715|nr:MULTISPECIES: hypothetical protein [Gordonia]AUH70577.1 hypothetical protein CXX93_19375 [Gordonia sp. YC-JH1]WFN95161.1 hypothetical protein P5P27_20565 [Gordonia sihwensis]